MKKILLILLSVVSTFIVKAQTETLIPVDWKTKWLPEVYYLRQDLTDKTIKNQYEKTTNDSSFLNYLHSKYNSQLLNLIKDSITTSNEIQTLTNKRKELEIKQEKYEQVYGVPSSLIADEIKKIGGSEVLYYYYSSYKHNYGLLGNKFTHQEDLRYEIYVLLNNIREVENLIKINEK